MAYSPLGIFVGLSQSELDAIRAKTQSRLVNGSWTTVGGGGKNGTKSWMDSDPMKILAEVKYAEQQSGTRAGRVSKVYQTTSSDYPHRRY